MLAGLVGGLGAALAGVVGRANPVSAAPGDPMRLGQSNNSGTQTTTLTANTTGSAALDFVQNGPGIGLRGFADNGHGGLFRTARSDRFGFIAANDAAGSGSGGAISAVGDNNHGLVAESDSSSRNGVRATHGHQNGSAIHGVSDHDVAATTGRGVQGTASGGGALILFIPIPSAGVMGVHERTGSTTIAAGVWGQALAPTAAGVRGLNFASTGAAIGVRGGTLSDDGFAGWFDGDVEVTGTVTAAAAGLRIDHPLDPANKYLQHSSVESSEMMNLYAGNATTDAAGNATVDLPQWFGALNGDFRYQLTTVGQFAQAIVSSEINKNRFSIKTDKPNVKVSWQVAGVRRDALAEAKRMRVEIDKPAEVRGKYLHPVQHGQAKSSSISDYFEGPARDEPSGS